MTTTNHSNDIQSIPHLDPQKGRQSSLPGTLQRLFKDSRDAVASHTISSDALRPGPSSAGTFSGGDSSRSSSYQESDSSKAVIVSSILNVMYGRSAKLQPSNVSTRPLGGSSTRIHIQPGASTSRLEVSGDSSESISVSQSPLKKVSSIPRNWISSASMSVKSGRSSSNISTGSGSRENYVEGSHISTESRDSASTSTSKSSVRIVGRGGSGSRVRLAVASTDTLDSSSLRSGAPPSAVRPAGRGGLASRPKPLEPVPEPLQDAPQSPVVAVSPEEPQKFVRPRGRGGAGSRLKPVSGASDSPGILHILSKRKSKSKSSRSLKGKRKDVSNLRRAVHPIPPALSYQITNTSLSTLSTLHFEGETGTPDTPFFPQESSTSDSTNDDGNSVSPDSTSVSLSTFGNTASTSKTTLDATEFDDDSDSEQLRPSTPTARREKSRNKLERTLGDVPPPGMHIFPKNGISSPKEKLPKLLIGTTLPTKDKAVKASRHGSLSVSSLASLFSRSSGKSESHTLSTLTDDLHQFGLEDDLSESWGEVNRNSMYGSISGSPIVFSPPSPIVVKHCPPSPDTPIATQPLLLPVPPPPKPEVVAQKNEDDDEYLVAPSPTISRSLSYTTQRRRSGRGTHTASASLHTDIRLDNNGVALRSNWVIPPGREDGDVAFITRDLPERPQAWTGEWNSDLTNVIKSLRALR